MIYFSPIDEQPRLLSGIQRYLEERSMEFDRISPERAVLLMRLAQHVHRELAEHDRARLVFICTHNSRRSQIAQLCCAAAATQVGVAGVETFSGGTEGTAFHPSAVAALVRAGFAIERTTEGENPVHHARFTEGLPPAVCFSKRFDDPPNPTEGFAAVMTCTEADGACPAVPGASARFALPYDDPKASDGGPEEAETYDERCRQIAREMLYAFSQVRPV